jgi:microcystin-dependent protein
LSEPFLGEVRMMSFTYPPRGWATCSGQLLPINQNQALFALLGTMYGGNGQTTFGLPNLLGRVPVHRGGGFTQGQAFGETSHTLTQSEMPAHTHGVVVDNTGPASQDGNRPANNKRLSGSAPVDLWGPETGPQPMNQGVIGDTGGSQPHDNMSPYTVIGFCIALVGIFPSPN